MKMLSERGQQVSYRIGARPYSLYPDFATFRTGSAAEEMRNFKIIDIGEILGAKEARPGSGLFKEFCEDVFRRRLSYAGPKSKRLLTTVFGKNETPEQKARRYVRSNRTNVVRSQDRLDEEYRAVLAGVAKRDPLSARLGVAWVLQRAARKQVDISPVGNRIGAVESASSSVVEEGTYSAGAAPDCGGPAATYEVVRAEGHCLPVGEKHPGVPEHLPVHLGRVQEVRSDSCANETPPEGIPENIQDVGIHEASSYWFRKIKADPNGGDDRHRFIGVLGTELRSGLRNDRRMSYPGETGFTLVGTRVGCERGCQRAFLNRCVAYGVLESFRHTPKSKHRGQSTKWYLSPILTPYFQVPTRRTKEPRYLRVSSLRKWMKSADVRSVAWPKQAPTRMTRAEPSSEPARRPLHRLELTCLEGVSPFAPGDSSGT